MTVQNFKVLCVRHRLAGLLGGLAAAGTLVAAPLTVTTLAAIERSPATAAISESILSFGVLSSAAGIAIFCIGTALRTGTS